VTPKIFFALVLAMSTGAIGEMLLKIGMDQLGEVSINSFGDLARHPLIIFRSRVLLLALLFMATHFYSYLTLLSLADLSWVLPMNSISFVFGVLLAQFVLKEQVSAGRWIGTLIICFGVYLVASGEAKTKAAERARAPVVVPPTRSVG